MFIGDQLRSEYADICEILEKNLDTVKDLYLQALGLDLDKEETGEESAEILCIIVSACLLYNKEKVEYPISIYEDDDDLIDKIYEYVHLLLLLENMVEKNVIVKSIKDGETVFSLPTAKK